MPVTIRVLESEPIIISRFTGDVMQDDVRQWDEEVVKLAEEVASSIIYHVIDMRRASTRHPTLLERLDATRRIPAGPSAMSLADKQLQGILVDKVTAVRQATDVPRIGDIEFPLFYTPEQAANYARSDLAQRQSQSA